MQLDIPTPSHCSVLSDTNKLMYIRFLECTHHKLGFVIEHLLSSLFAGIKLVIGDWYQEHYEHCGTLKLLGLYYH